MFNHSPPPIPPSLFIHLLLASITKVSITFYSTSVLDPLLRDLRKIMSLPTSTPAGINPYTIAYNSLSTSLKPSSKSRILSISPSSLWKTQPSNRLYSFTNTSNYLPTHFLTSIDNSVVSTNGNMCHISPVSPFNRPFNVTMMSNMFFFFQV